MTLQGFFQSLRYYLRKSKDKFIQVEPPWQSGYQIRSSPDDLCPVCYLATKKTNKEYDNFDYRKAGKKLGLDSKIVSDIVDAADHINPKFIRRKLLREKLERLCSQ